MKKLILYALSVVMVICVVSSDAFAKITVISVRGRVAYKSGRSWIPLRKGMRLNEGVKVSTGVRSYAVLRLNSHVMRIRPLTMIKIHQNKLTRNSSRTRIALKRGSLRARIKKGKRVRTVFKVSTPVATSSVRGTDEGVSVGPIRGFRGVVYEGSVEGRSRNGSRNTISGRQQYRQGSGSSTAEGILDETRGNSFGSVNDPNLSPDEQGSLDGNSDFLDDAGGGAVDIVDSDTGAPGARVNLNITWPDK
jgi:hypothetical protein